MQTIGDGVFDIAGVQRMPIRPENRKRYPKIWPVISYCIRADRARWFCENCGAANGKPHPVTGSKVVLTVAHLDHQPENCSLQNLMAMCQRCHNSYDAAERRRNRRKRLELANGQELLFRIEGSDGKKSERGTVED